MIKLMEFLKDFVLFDVIGLGLCKGKIKIYLNGKEKLSRSGKPKWIYREVKIYREVNRLRNGKEDDSDGKSRKNNKGSHFH